LVSFEMSDKRDATVGRRLRHLRQALGYRHGNTFAHFLGVPATRWNNLENGFPLSKEVAFLLLRRVSGLSLDWLYLGRTDGLSMRLGRKLGEFTEEPPTPSRRNNTTS
jgi:transcriptional regulator with XRE-family HTH domain